MDLGKTIKEMELVKLNTLMEINMKAIISMIVGKVKVK